MIEEIMDEASRELTEDILDTQAFFFRGKIITGLFSQLSGLVGVISESFSPDPDDWEAMDKFLDECNEALMKVQIALRMLRRSSSDEDECQRQKKLLSDFITAIRPVIAYSNKNFGRVAG